MNLHLNEEHERILGKQINVIGEEMYFRNNSTGKPTLIHFIDPSSLKTYCGFKSFGAENIIGDDTDTVTESQCCKKCLKHFIGAKELQKIHLRNKNNPTQSL